MIGANQYDLSWSHFDKLHEDKKTAFENLSRSLFLKELCYEGTIEELYKCRGCSV